MGQRRRIDVFSLKNRPVNIQDVTTQYTKLYNREVKEFYQLSGFVDYEIRGSMVHADSHVRYLEKKVDHRLRNLNVKDDAIVEIGSFWTGEEKRRFFKLLERYSIHRLDEWCHCFQGSKSKIEILTYYKLLSKNLKMLQNGKFKKLMKRIDLPIAYEMDETFIEFEEIMAQRMIERNSLGYYSETKISEGSELFSLEKWNHRWNKIYRKSKLKTDVEEKVNIPRVPLNYTTESISFLEKITRKYIRKVLRFSILPNINKRYISKKELINLSKTTENDRNEYIKDEEEISKDEEEIAKEEEKGILVVNGSEGKEKYPHVITKEQIDKGLMVMKREGHYVKTIGGNIIDMINKFEIEYEQPGNLFRNKHIAESIIPDIIHEKLNAVKGLPIGKDYKLYEDDLLDELKKVGPSNDITNINGKTTEEMFLRKLQKLDIAMYGKFHKNKNPTGNDEENNFTIINDDKELSNCKIIDELLEQRLDNEVETELLSWETETLERHDMKRSQQYLDTMYHYFIILDEIKKIRRKQRRREMLITNKTYDIIQESEEATYTGEIEPENKKESMTRTKVTTEPIECPISLPKTMLDWFDRT